MSGGEEGITSVGDEGIMRGKMGGVVILEGYGGWKGGGRAFDDGD